MPYFWFTVMHWSRIDLPNASAPEIIAIFYASDHVFLRKCNQSTTTEHSKNRPIYSGFKLLVHSMNLSKLSIIGCILIGYILGISSRSIFFLLMIRFPGFLSFGHRKVYVFLVNYHGLNAGVFLLKSDKLINF